MSGNGVCGSIQRPERNEGENHAGMRRIVIADQSNNKR